MRRYSLVFPASLACYALIASPRPGPVFWVVMLVYSEAGAYTRPLYSSTPAYFVGYAGYMIFPQSIRQGNMGRCNQNGLG
jgi:hypothetical protein